MKRFIYMAKGLAALALIVLFSQCAGNTNTSTNTQDKATTVASGEFSMAYVDVDSLLSKYNFCVDLNEAMVKKEENIRLTLNQKAAALEKEQQEFQKKYENNAFISQDRAQQEYNRLMKAQQDLQALSNKLTTELANENAKNSLQLRDSISIFLKDFNKDKKYSVILSNTGLDNILYADDAMNITDEVVAGLNARYVSEKKK